MNSICVCKDFSHREWILSHTACLKMSRKYAKLSDPYNVQDGFKQLANKIRPYLPDDVIRGLLYVQSKLPETEKKLS